MLKEFDKGFCVYMRRVFGMIKMLRLKVEPKIKGELLSFLFADGTALIQHTLEDIRNTLDKASKSFV